MAEVYGRLTGDAQSRLVSWKLVNTDPVTGEGVYAPIMALEPLSIGGGGGGPSTTVALDAATLAALETISVANFPAVQPVSDNGGSLTVDGTVAVSNFPATQPVSGTFWQTTQPVSGPLTDTQLRATPVPVSGTFWQATQPVSGPLTDAQLRAASVPISDGGGSLTVDGTFWQATQPVSGTFWQATQPVSGPLTDAQLRAVAVPVSGTFWQATQPVSGTFWQATQPVSGTFWQATQPVSIAASVTTVDAGPTAADAPLTANPITTGGRSSDATPAKMSADADVVNNWVDRRGATIVRDREDMNRTQKSWKFTSTAAAAAETILTVVPMTNFVDAAGATTFAVTANKIMRITHITVSLRTTTAAAPWGRLRLRANAGGAAIITSPLVMTVGVAGGAAVIGSTGVTTINLDEELEFSGTQQFCLTFENNVATNVTDITLLGYEYDN